MRRAVDVVDNILCNLLSEVSQIYYQCCSALVSLAEVSADDTVMSDSNVESSQLRLFTI